MDTTTVLRSSDLQRIDAIACNAIIEYFIASTNILPQSSLRNSGS